MKGKYAGSAEGGEEQASGSGRGRKINRKDIKRKNLWDKIRKGKKIRKNGNTIEEEKGSENDKDVRVLGIAQSLQKITSGFSSSSGGAKPSRGGAYLILS